MTHGASRPQMEQVSVSQGRQLACISQCIRTLVRATRANAIAQRWIASTARAGRCSRARLPEVGVHPLRGANARVSPQGRLGGLIREYSRVA